MLPYKLQLTTVTATGEGGGPNDFLVGGPKFEITPLIPYRTPKSLLGSARLQNSRPGWRRSIDQCIA